MESQQTSQEFLSDEEDVTGIELEPELEDISTNMRFSRQSGHTIGVGEMHFSQQIKLQMKEMSYTVFKSKWQIVNLCGSKTTSLKAFKFSVNVGNN